MTQPQTRALACLKANHGTACEDTLWMEGLNLPRTTMRSLEKRGLVERGEWLNEHQGYEWKLVRASDPAGLPTTGGRR